MTPTTLRKELITKIFEILEDAYQDNPPSEDATAYNKEQAEKIADAVREVSGIAKRIEQVNDPMWDLLHGKEIKPDAAWSEEAVHDVCLRLEKGLRRGQFPETPAAQLVYKWILAREQEGQKLEDFIKWAMDGRRAEFSFIYHKDPNLIKRDWPMAMSNQSEKPSDRSSMIRPIS